MTPNLLPTNKLEIRNVNNALPTFSEKMHLESCMATRMRWEIKGNQGKVIFWSRAKWGNAWKLKLFIKHRILVSLREVPANFHNPSSPTRVGEKWACFEGLWPTTYDAKLSFCGKWNEWMIEKCMDFKFRARESFKSRWSWFGAVLESHDVTECHQNGAWGSSYQGSPWCKRMVFKTTVGSSTHCAS